MFEQFECHAETTSPPRFERNLILDRPRPGNQHHHRPTDPGGGRGRTLPTSATVRSRRARGRRRPSPPARRVRRRQADHQRDPAHRSLGPDRYVGGGTDHGRARRRRCPRRGTAHGLRRREQPGDRGGPGVQRRRGGHDSRARCRSRVRISPPRRSATARSSSVGTTVRACAPPRSPPPTAPPSSCSAISPSRCGIRPSRRSARSSTSSAAPRTGTPPGPSLRCRCSTRRRARCSGSATFPNRLTDAVAATVHGQVYVFGGQLGGRISDQVWRLDLGPTGSAPVALTPVATLPTPVDDAAIAVAPQRCLPRRRREPRDPADRHRRWRSDDAARVGCARHALALVRAACGRNSVRATKPTGTHHRAVDRGLRLDQHLPEHRRGRTRMGGGPGRQRLRRTPERARSSPTVADIPTRVYVPNSVSNTVDVIDPTTLTVVDHFAVGNTPQHVVPATTSRRCT